MPAPRISTEIGTLPWLDRNLDISIDRWQLCLHMDFDQAQVEPPWGAIDQVFTPMNIDRLLNDPISGGLMSLDAVAKHLGVTAACVKTLLDAGHLGGVFELDNQRFVPAWKIRQAKELKAILLEAVTET